MIYCNQVFFLFTKLWLWFAVVHSGGYWDWRDTFEIAVVFLAHKPRTAERGKLVFIAFIIVTLVTCIDLDTAADSW